MNLRVTPNGLEAEVRGHDGAHWYVVRPARRLRDGGLLFELIRLDRQTAHLLSLSVRGHWSCDCGAYKHRARRGKELCKHCEALGEVLAFLPYLARLEPEARDDLMGGKELEGLMAALQEPFDPSEIKFKPAVVSGNRALALPYVDARVIEDRLDRVFGVAGWQDEYEFLPDGSCLCRLRVRIGDEWIVKMDVGGQSEQPDEGDRRKAAVSDAMKRAAVKLGIGRYLYRMPQQWCDYDPQKRQFKSQPQLPVTSAVRPRVAPPPVESKKSEERYQACLTALKEAKDAKRLDKLRKAYQSDQDFTKEQVADFEALYRHKMESFSVSN